MHYIEDGVFCEKVQIQKNLKTVFLIGDSIRLGYCETVKNELRDIANVVYPTDNCKYTQNVLTCIEDWAGICDGSKVDAVQFNCGHWDVAHWGGEEESLNSIKTYSDNIARIVKKLKKLFPNAKIIFATTTAMNPNGTIGRNPRSNTEITAYNRAAIEACGTDALINDLFAVTCEYGENMYADYCHLTKEGFEELGKKVAAYIRSLLF